MILTCPSCGTRYRTDARLTAPGMNVRCAKCGHVWFHTITAGEIEPLVEHVPEPVPEPVPVEALVPDRAPEVDAFLEPPLPPEPEIADPIAAVRASLREGSLSPGEDRATADMPTMDTIPDATRKPGLRDAGARAMRGVAWLALILFVVGVVWATITYRQAIAELWPRSSSFYAAIGMPVNIRGLAFQDVAFTQEYEDGLPVLSITGKVVNVTTRELPVPQVRVSLSDIAQRELHAWNVDVGTPTLRPGETRTFVTRLTSPPLESKTVDVRFVQSGETP